VTLAELLVAMILLAIIGGAMTRVMVKQSQYYRDSSASLSARRELRLGATVLPAEIRSISTAGGDILSMSESQITMRAAIGSSIICARGANTFTIPPANLAKHTLTSFASTPVIGDTVFLYDENILKGSEDDVWRKFAIATTSASAAACVGAPYTDPVLDLPATKPRLVYSVVTGPINDSVKVGAVVRFTRPVRYKIYQESSGNWYLGVQENQNGAWQTTDPLAGPYRPFASGDGNPSGLQFRYYDTLGVRITDMGALKSVGRIDVFLRTNAGTAAVTERQGNALRDSVVMRVAIRNSK
jgi:hypothetical protein